MSIDLSLFYSKSPDMLADAGRLQEAHIKEFAEFGALEAETLRKYREKRSVLLKKALEEKIPVTIAGDIIRGECAAEKEAYMKAQTDKQKARYNIQRQQTRMDNIRHINRGIEYAAGKGGQQ